METQHLQLLRVAKCVQYFSNLYSRIAGRLGVDRSYVSRVARGERRSALIESALVADFKHFQRNLITSNKNDNTTERRGCVELDLRL